MTLFLCYDWSIINFYLNFDIVFFVNFVRYFLAPGCGPSANTY